MGEVDVRALAVPELANARPVCSCIADKGAARANLGIRRVLVEQATAWQLRGQVLN